MWDEYEICATCNGWFPPEDLVEGRCLWDWAKEDRNEEASR